LWIAIPPSMQHVTKNSPEGEYAIFIKGLLNYENSSATHVLSMSKILMTPDSNPHANIGIVE
jgi:hypothetical protein